MDIEQVYSYLIALVCEHSCYSKCVAAIVARPGKHHDGSIRSPSLCNGMSDGLGCPLHQVNRRDGFVLNGVFVMLVNLSRGENLHNDAKIQNYY